MEKPCGLSDQSILVAIASRSMPVGDACAPNANCTDSIVPVNGNKPLLAYSSHTGDTQSIPTSIVSVPHRIGTCSSTRPCATCCPSIDKATFAGDPGLGDSGWNDS